MTTIMDRRNLVFIDCETTGLNPDWHEIWELVLVRYTGDPDKPGEPWAHRWLISPLHLDRADAGALRINNFYDREWEDKKAEEEFGVFTTRVRANPIIGTGHHTAAREIAVFVSGKYLVGANPSFDARFLEAFLRRHGQAPAWSHRLIDVESMAIPKLTENHGLPRSLGDTARALDIEVDDEWRHGAYYDAELARLVYEELT